MHKGRKIMPSATLHSINHSSLQLLGRKQLAIYCT